MTNLSTKKLPTYAGVCSVCFHTHNLNTAKGSTLNPIRHGFHIVGGSGQGHAGGWHTGPCAGVGFPHFGFSTAGTEYALTQILSALTHAVKLLTNLNARPELSWSFQPTKYQSATWQTRKSTYVPAGSPIERVLKPGTLAESITYPNPDGSATYAPTKEVQAPSYEQELASRIIEAQHRVDALLRDKLKYQTAIDAWKPADKTIAVKVELVHRARKVTYREHLVPACRPRVSSWEASKLKLSDDKAQITCKRCK